ncbi:MAG: class I SAM-dependent rRNA methyltransferase [Candidatus Symbiobacter sp.]|nr:class I SAM-dependent rRNA methyltransferase [Candidatus Symbiobacter sp.]
MAHSLPHLTLLPGRDKRVRGGHPWLYSNEIKFSALDKQLPPGTLVAIQDAQGGAVGFGLFNPQHLIAVRMLGRGAPPANQEGGFWAGFWTGFFRAKLFSALRYRQRLFQDNYYRLVHAEADGLPGIIIDRYDQILAGQINIAWPDAAVTALMTAAQAILEPNAMIWRDDKGETFPVMGDESALSTVMLVENGTKFVLDLKSGQKTGWFYDHAANRRRIAAFSAGRSLLDLFCYQGGFGIAALVAGAQSAHLVDGSAAALARAAQAAQLNHVADRCQFERGDVFDILERMAEKSQKFDVVVADPPAFVKSRKDLAVGLKAYRKLFALAAGCVGKDGLLFAASCSHNVSEIDFLECVRQALSRAGRTGRIIRADGANGDHPRHPHLDESAYLKSLLLQLE